MAYVGEAYWSNFHNDCIIPDMTVGGTGENEDNLTYHGGPVMQNPKIWMIFRGADWNTRTTTPTKSQLTQDIRDKLLGTSDIYFSALNQYSGCGVPVWGGAVTNTNIAYPSGDFTNNIFGNNAHALLWSVIVDSINTGQIPLSSIDFNNTQFIVIPEADKIDPDSGIGGYHTDIVVSITFPPTEPDPGGGGTNPFPEIFHQRAQGRRTIVIPGTSGTGTGGGTLPPDTTVPPPGATVIKPIVSWAIVEVVDPLTSTIHSSLPDWDGNNTVTRPLAQALIQSQVNTDQFARFGPAGWSRNTGTNNQIGESPCQFTQDLDNVHRYGDGLGVQAYWSNVANNCIVPGRGDLDLGNSQEVVYHGGRIMKNPLVVLIFWGPDG